MKPWMPVGVASALLVLVLAFALGPIDFGAAGPRENRASIEELDERLADFDNRLTLLAVRLDELEAKRATALPPLSRETDRAVDDDSRLESLEQRVAALEQEPETRPESLPLTDGNTARPTAPLDQYELLTRISMLGKPDAQAEKQRTSERIDLLREYLERFPDQAGASGNLRLLTSLLIRSGRSEEMLEDLDRFASAVGLEDWQRDEIAVNYYSARGDREGQRRLYEKILSNPRASESATASARFFTAYTHYQAGELDKAEEGFLSLIHQYGDDPPAAVRNTVQGAKNYLEKIRNR